MLLVNKSLFRAHTVNRYFWNSGQCGGVCNHPTSNWPYLCHHVPYLVPWTPDCLSPLRSDLDHWPYAPGACSHTGKWWWKLHNWLNKYRLWELQNEREWGQQRSSIAISRMVRQPATNCPKDCQTTVTSLQLSLQSSVWHWTITNTWAQSIMK